MENDIEIDAIILALGKYIIRGCSSDAYGESADNKLFDELFSNDDIIPGIEQIWPIKCRPFL